jgi:hypothetical protein
MLFRAGLLTSHLAILLALSSGLREGFLAACTAACRSSSEEIPLPISGSTTVMSLESIKSLPVPQEDPGVPDCLEESILL